MAMDKFAADSYVYAKASAKLSKSFVGPRSSHLFEQQSLKDLWELLFSDEVPHIPQMMLAREIESRAEKEFILSYKKLLSNYDHPDLICVSLLHFYDYENLKLMAAVLSSDSALNPTFVDISPFSFINLKNWPDIKSVTQKTPVEWFDSVTKGEVQQQTDFKLDCQYIHEIMTSAEKITDASKQDVISLLTEKFSMENIVWALRLKIYYKYPAELIAGELAYLSEEKSRNDPIAKEALKIAEWDTDDFSAWNSWKHKNFFNPHTEGSLWQCDPAWILQKFRIHYIHRAYNLFYKFPLTVCPLVTWFILKQDELNNIRTATESLRLNIKL